ncbi:uncharacterized protein LOC142163793 [Nicotiana tabacum]|uniref:Uncharacterized protein LOC142163793 n=1 Tax=Nicotiana tabacum TaxID=4097 RepID=A0AC58RWG5_TOBAC
MEEYLQQLHSIASSLRSIGKPVTDEDLVAQALQGLPSSYRTFISGLNAAGSLPSFIALRPLLLTEEAHISENPSENSNSQTALLASTHKQSTTNSPTNGLSHRKSFSYGRGRGRNQKGNNGRGREYYNQQYNPSFSSPWSGSHSKSRPSFSANGILGRPPTQCQICFHFNHTALECKNRFNHSFAHNNLPKTFAAMNVEEMQPTIWYPDSGASAHMTNDPSLLSSPTPYTGSSQVMVTHSLKFFQHLMFSDNSQRDI